MNQYASNVETLESLLALVETVQTFRTDRLGDIKANDNKSSGQTKHWQLSMDIPNTWEGQSKK